MIFLILTQGFVISHSSALSFNKNSPTKNLTNIADICLSSPFSCLQHIDNSLSTTPKNSRVYFEILQYKMEALFNLQKSEELYQETKQWLNKPKLPIPFQVTNAIYFAKSAWYIGEKEAAKKSYLLAKSLLAQMNEAYPSPLRLVQFANLQMQLDEHQQAYDLMLGLAKKYSKSPDTRFMMELHGNLGHAANKLGFYKESLKHWQETIPWAFEFGNKQQIAVVLYNLADLHDILSQYDQAEKHFIQAISYAVKAGDKVKANQARLHLLQTQLKQGTVCHKNSIIEDLDSQYLSKTAKADLTLLKNQLTLC